MRYLKHKIDRQSLERLYIAFIRPILEYGNIIWDNCTQEESDLIESVQQAAARIVTGLRKGTPRWKLYKELGWDSLQNRRQKNKLLFLHKTISGDIPNYIAADILSYTNTNDQYGLRKKREFKTPQCRTTAYKNSFIPHTLEKWNSLDGEVKNILSFTGFKRKLNEDISPCPVFFSTGSRKVNIIHCQLRNEASDLKDHLFCDHLSDSSICACGDPVEDNFHFFYVCPFYIYQRYELFRKISNFNNVNLDVLLQGCSDFNIDENTEIFTYVQQYIHETGRFL